MGGLEVQAVQEQLLASGSSLASHGVYRAILLAPVPVAKSRPGRRQPTTVASSVSALRQREHTVCARRPRRTVWRWLQHYGEHAPSAGDHAGRICNGFHQILIGAEPLVTARTTGGRQFPICPRPSAREGAFALRNGTLLSVIGFSEDVLTPGRVAACPLPAPTRPLRSPVPRGRGAGRRSRPMYIINPHRHARPAA